MPATSERHNSTLPIEDGGTTQYERADGIARLDDAVLVKMADNIGNLAEISYDAAAATEYERKMTLLQAIKMYPKPAFFSMLMSLSLIMEGYDTSLLGNFFGFPAFQQKFGRPVGDGTYQLTANLAVEPPSSCPSWRDYRIMDSRYSG